MILRSASRTWTMQSRAWMPCRIERGAACCLPAFPRPLTAGILDQQRRAVENEKPFMTLLVPADTSGSRAGRPTIPRFACRPSSLAIFSCPGTNRFRNRFLQVPRSTRRSPFNMAVAWIFKIPCQCAAIHHGLRRLFFTSSNWCTISGRQMARRMSVAGSSRVACHPTRLIILALIGRNLGKTPSHPCHHNERPHFCQRV